MSIDRLHVVVEPDPDLPGQWTAHVLDLDVVTQGNSLEHALRMAAEACALVLADDLEAGLDLKRRRAPAHFWGEVGSILS